MKSLFMLHNETTNIWSHLYGVYLYIFLIVYLIFWTVPDMTESLDPNGYVLGVPIQWILEGNKFISKHILWIDADITQTREISKIPLLIHMVGNIFCMSMSSIYHLFCCHSKEMNCKLYKYDYTGVSVMIACSIYPPYVYGFMCQETLIWAYVYTGFINISSILLVIVCIHPKFDNAGYRNLRTILYVIVGLSCSIPAFHYVFFHDANSMAYSNLSLWALGGFFYVFGAYIYASRWPEKKYPGKFDYFGQSHNIWHFLVLWGGVTHFFASLSNYYGRRAQECPIPI